MLTLDKAQQMVQKAKDSKKTEKTNEIKIVSTQERPTIESGETYSLSEVARYLKVSENRIRHWEKSYTQALSNHRNQYNHRIFTSNDVKALEKIKFLQDSGLYTKQGILTRLKSKIKDMPATEGIEDREYRQKLLVALNTLAAEIKGLRREVREDLQGNMKSEIEHLALLLFPPKKEKKSWWKIFGK